MDEQNRSAIARRRVLRVAGGDAAEDLDDLAVEAPLELRCGGRALAVVLRTPGRDEELARGLLWAEGVVQSAAEAARVRAADPATLRADEVGHVIDVGLDPALVEERWPGRALPASSACGACGAAALAGLEDRATPLYDDLRAPAELIASLPDRLRAAQDVFAATGGLHAAGLFSASGELLACREDVGRHNAVDKVVGWALSAGRLPLAGTILCASGRLGYEIVAKAITAGIPLIAAVSAPSSLAVDLAERYRITLCAFVRGGRFNVYSHRSRVAL